MDFSIQSVFLPAGSEIGGAAAALDFGDNEDLVTVADGVGVQSPGAALELLGSQHVTHLPVDVEEAHAVGGQLQQRSQLLLQVAHRLLQTQADRLHPLTPTHVHGGAARSQVHLSQRRQLSVLGHQDVVPARRQRSL